MAAVRVLLTDFSLRNPLYANASVQVLEVDPSALTPTSTLAPLYDAATGGGTLANPQTLDNEGKWVVPPYVDRPVVLRVGSATVATHDTGVEGPLGTFKGSWASGVAYTPGDTVEDDTAGANTTNLYICSVPHTAGTWATDLGAGYWALYINKAAIAAAAAALVSTAGNDLSGATVLVPATIKSRSLADRFGQTLNVLDFNAKCDGVTDDSAALLAALQFLYSAGGGTLTIPPGKVCRADSALLLPYTGPSSPAQPPIRIIGGGGSQNGYWSGVRTGGSALDLRYGGGSSAVAKIDTRGAGVLMIQDLSIVDGGSSNFQMIQTTNTQLILERVAFFGNAANSGTACAQDAILFGGKTAASITLGTDAATAGFQGYGSAVRDCYFERVRVAAEFGGSANAIYLVNNTVSKTCGSAAPQGAPYVLAGQGYGASGNVFVGGVIEVTHYPYGVAMLDDGTGTALNELNYFSGLGIYDESMGTPTVAGFYFSTHSTNNTVLPGFSDTAIQTSGGGTLTYFDGPSKLLNTLWNAGGFPTQVHGKFTVQDGGVYSGNQTFSGVGDYVILAASSSNAGFEVHAPSGATTLFVNNGPASVYAAPTGTNAAFTVAANGTGTLVLGAATNATTMPGVYTGPSYANDAAAAAGGVPLGGIYRNGTGGLQIRMT